MLNYKTVSYWYFHSYCVRYVRYLHTHADTFVQCHSLNVNHIGMLQIMWKYVINITSDVCIEVRKMQWFVINGKDDT